MSLYSRDHKTMRAGCCKIAKTSQYTNTYPLVRSVEVLVPGSLAFSHSLPTEIPVAS